MTSIFVSHAQAEDACAEQIRLGLIAQGYTILRESPTLTLESLTHPRTIETLILGSATVVLLWSQQAAQSVEVQKQAAFAQHVRKSLVVVALDTTPLPIGLVALATLSAQLPCADIVTHLLPFLPSPQHPDSLTTLAEQATHERIRVRKEAIELASAMLARDEQREAVLAILDYLALHDLISSVRDKAQEALHAATLPSVAPTPLSLLSFRPEDRKHIFGVRCPKGHLTYFDKRLVCSKRSLVRADRPVRTDRGEEIELDLPCGTEGCTEVVPVKVDCRGYL